MSQKNDTFFVEKKEWSKTKDELFGCYFKPYFSKIIHAKYPIVYVDCFAGKGKFDDGEDGSPLIALKIIDEALESANIMPGLISTYFIDINYASDLASNLPTSTSKRAIHIIDGAFEDEIDKILSKVHKANVFLYIDPYGIKALDVPKLRTILRAFNLAGIEILINFNSFGFYRQACNVLRVKIDKSINDYSEFLVEYDESLVDSEEEMNRIFGSSSWKDIVYKCKRKEITAFEAEIELSNEFCKNLQVGHSGFKYVLNMPLRKGDEVNPKYRMIHATNHADGCLLMANNMYARSQTHRLNRLNGGMSLFELDVNDNMTSPELRTQELLSLIGDDEIEIRDLLCRYFLKFGIKSDSKGLIELLKENEDKLIIRRIPETTSANKPTSFWSPSTGKYLYLRRKP